MNIRIKGYEIPVSAIIGLLATTGIWIIILITQAYSRWLGLSWMVLGLVIYYFIRKRRRSPADEWKVKLKKISKRGK